MHWNWTWHIVIPYENLTYCHKLAVGPNAFGRLNCFTSFLCACMWVSAKVSEWMCIKPCAICNLNMWTHSARANYRQRLICGLDYKPQGHLSSNTIIGFLRTNALQLIFRWNTLHFLQLFRFLHCLMWNFVGNCFISIDLIPRWWILPHQIWRYRVSEVYGK